MTDSLIEMFFKAKNLIDEAGLKNSALVKDQAFLKGLALVKDKAFCDGSDVIKNKACLKGSAVIKDQAYLETLALVKDEACKDSNKTVVFAKFFISFLLLGFSFVAQANFEAECRQKSKSELSSQEQIKEGATFIKECVKEKEKKQQQQQQQMLSEGIDCLQKLKNQFRISEVTVEKTRDDELKEDVTKIEDAIIINNLKASCQKAKSSTEECCSNPNACNGFGRDLVQHVLPLAPALVSTYKSYKISDDANKGNLTHEEAANKMCNASNQIAVGTFGANLLQQLMPMFKKTCGKRIKQCKQECNNSIGKFQEAFKYCYVKLFPKDRNVFQVIKRSKECLESDNNLQSETFDDDLFNNVQISGKLLSGLNSNSKKYQCNYSSAKGFEKINSNRSNNNYPFEITFLSEILYIAKAYQNTTKEQKYKLSDNSNEKHIVDCHNQPNRVLESSYQPGAPIPGPAIQLCKAAVETAVNGTPPPPSPPPMGTGQKTANIGSVGTLTGNTPKPGYTSLQVPDGKECEYGALDSETLKECLRDDTDEPEFETNNRPGLATNLPGFKGNSGGSGGGGSGGGGIGAGGLGSLAGNSDPSGSGSMYPPYSGDMSSSADFGDGDFGGAPYGEGALAGNLPYRDLAEESSTDTGLAGDMPFEEGGFGEKTIFQMASERIQNFCSGRSCGE